MANRKVLLLLLFGIFSSSDARPTAIKAAYWVSWLASSFPPSAINTSFFTHLYYAFILPDPVTYQLTVSSPDNTLMANFTATLHHQNPPAEALLSIGGGSGDAITTTFSLMASNSSSRKAFIDSTIAVARKYDFDGLDLDWEWPASSADMDSMKLLLSDWRFALNRDALATGRKRLLLTAAVYYSANVLGVPVSYPGKAIRRKLDWVNAMCFEYHGPWDTSETGAQAALYDPHSSVSTSFGIESWLSAGVPAHKVVMGVPLFGHTWKLKDPTIHGVGAPAVGVGPGNNGMMPYSDVVDFNAEKDATVVFDSATVSAYSYVGDSWIGYDDATSVTAKIQYGLGHRLGGYFLWAVNYDKDWTISEQAFKEWEH